MFFNPENNVTRPEMAPRLAGSDAAPADPVSIQTRPFRIAHVSDPHLSRKYYREHIKSFKMLLREIVDRGYDHIVITGDIVSTADEDDYYLAREIFSTLRLLSEDKLTLVPGNHDLFGGPHRAVDVVSFPQHIRRVDYHKHLALFVEMFQETFASSVRLLPENPFPFLKRVGPLTILGINSIPPWSLRRNPLGTNGWLHDAQVIALERLAQRRALQGQTVLAAIHHHFNDLNDDTSPPGLWKRIETSTMRLKKRRSTLKLLKWLGVQGILHGHIHRNELYEMQGVSIANGAGSVCDDPQRFLKFNEVVVDGGALAVKTVVLPIPYQVSTVDVAIARIRKPVTIPALPSLP